MDEARSDLEGGWDRWSRGFSELGAIADRTTVVRHEGRASRGIRSALVDGFRPVELLLGNEGLGATFDDSDGIRELQLHPAGSGAANRQQREDLDRGITEWSETVAGYLEAAAALYAYLDEAPDRAVPCFSHIFDEHTDGSGPLDDREAELALAVTEAMEEVSHALLIGSDQAYSLNELSRLVHDTFQGRLTLSVDGPIIEIEGLVEHETYVERPPVDLWRALEGMAGQWLSPDLVTTAVVPAPESEQPVIDPVDFSARPRRWSPAPDSWTVESDLRVRLRPEEVYLVRWHTRSADDDDEIDGALQRLAEAERELP